MKVRVFAGGLVVAALLSLFGCSKEQEKGKGKGGPEHEAAIVTIQALIQVIDDKGSCSQYLLPSGPGGPQVLTAFPWLHPKTSASSFDQIQWKALDKSGNDASVAITFNSTLGAEPLGTPFFKGSSFSAGNPGSFTPLSGAATVANPGDYYFQSVVVTDQSGNNTTCTNPVGAMGVHVQQ
jgi:hypothetical protein